MAEFRWDENKNIRLRHERQVGFEDVVIAISHGRLLDDLAHPNPQRYLEQRILVVNIDEYVYLVPYIEDRDYLVLKTIYPSRKFTKLYLGGKK